jgi:hypothetical protein
LKLRLRQSLWRKYQNDLRDHRDVVQTETIATRYGISELTRLKGDGESARESPGSV